MDRPREVVVIGEEDIGKTTLINALLGWDVLPQSYDYLPMPTTEKKRVQLAEHCWITDTPGYSLLWNTVPDDTVEAVAGADTVVALLSEELSKDGINPADFDPEWESRRAAEKTLLEKLLAGKHRDIIFVIPYDRGEWPYGYVPLKQGTRLAKARFASMTDRGTDGFFCVDPMKALIGAIEDNEKAIRVSGITKLKKALLG